MPEYRIAGAYTDPYNDINNILNLKGSWAAASGDQARQNEIAKKAQQYYASLRRNGYGDIADRLTASDATSAKPIRDMYAKRGRTATRPYIATALKKYGLSDDDINNRITYDNDTGEVFLGGIRIGKPDTVVDGTSYWEDTSKLDNGISQFVKSAGLQTPIELKWNETYGDAQKAVNDMSGEVKQSAALSNEAMREGINANKTYFRESQTPTTMSQDYRRVWGDVMPAFEYEADKAGRNTLASRDNGGNIDSFAAANSRRQREASYANGARLAAELGIGARQTTLDNMNRGVSNFTNMSSASSQNAINHAQANYTNSKAYTDLLGMATDEMTQQAGRRLTDAQAEELKAKANDLWGQMLGQNTAAALARLYPGYMNSDGTFKDNIKDTDIEAMLEDFVAKNPNYKDDPNLNAFYNNAVALRTLKGLNVPGHLGYLSKGNVGTSTYAPQDLERYNIDTQANTTRYVTDKNAATTIYGIDSNERMANAENQLKLQLQQMGLTDAEAERQLERWKAELAAGIATADGTSAITDKKAKDIISQINSNLGKGTITGGEDLGYTVAGDKRGRVVGMINNSLLTTKEKMAMLYRLGFTDEELKNLENGSLISSAVNEYTANNPVNSTKID